MTSDRLDGHLYPLAASPANENPVRILVLVLLAPAAVALVVFTLLPSLQHCPVCLYNCTGAVKDTLSWHLYVDSSTARQVVQLFERLLCFEKYGHTLRLVIDIKFCLSVDHRTFLSQFRACSVSSARALSLGATSR